MGTAADTGRHSARVTGSLGSLPFERIMQAVGAVKPRGIVRTLPDGKELLQINERVP